MDSPVGENWTVIANKSGRSSKVLLNESGRSSKRVMNKGWGIGLGTRVGDRVRN